MERIRVDVGTDVNELREHLLRIETTVGDLSERLGRVYSIKGVSSLADIDGSTSDAHNDENEHARHRVYKPEIRRCDFIGFKNHFNEEDASYACDVLVSDSLSTEDVLEEQRLRDRLDEYAIDGSQTAKHKAQMLIRESEKTSRALRNDQLESKWIQRIRIQSPFLLETLSRAHSESWTTAPRIYNRPFCTLAHHHDSMTRTLAELDSQCSGSELGSDATKSLADNIHVCTSNEVNTPRDNLDEIRANRDILKAYVDFMESDILPDVKKYTKMSHKDGGTIRFSDLCYLFSPGDILYRPAEGEKVGESRRSRVGQRLWKITRVNEPGRYGDLTSDANQSSTTQSNFADQHPADFVVNAFHVDFTGEEFCVVQHNFAIPPFQGQKPIYQLPFFPRRFALDCESFSEEATEIGKKVLDHIENKHAYYDAWTVTRSPQDGDVIDETGRILRHPEPINSEVIVDFREAFQFCPDWQPARSVLKAEAPNISQANDPFPLRRWSGKDRSKLLYEVKEIVPRRTGVHALQRNAFVTTDTFLKKVAHNDQMGQMTTARDIGVDEEQLLHCRIFAYVFRDRKFAQLDAGALRPATKSPTALSALKIPDMHKNVIQRSVEGYFINKRNKMRNTDPRARGGSSSSMDVIPGKGSGLFLLLHGAPGVGKTMTAEAIAQANGKPLFKITCGDIGLTPDQVETSLRGIFRLASVWDCILLMDEVDTFFSQRSKGDGSVKKNALVSVFLRVLDYYEGILFLTTNRPGALDEAFKSRIHYKIYYSPLTKRQTLDIWRHNIDRLRARYRHTDDQISLEIRDDDIMDFADEQFELSQRKQQSPWSGRQIRNAFQVAQSLAFYDAHMKQRDESAAHAPAILVRNYFNMMSDITEDFDNYMAKVLGMSDSQHARELEHRDDDFGATIDRAFPNSGRVDHEGSSRRYAGTRSPLGIDVMAPERRPRSYSNGRGVRPGIITGISPRPNPDGFLQPGPSNPYDDSSRNGQNSPGLRHNQSDAYDTDPMYRINSASSRWTSAFGRSAERSYTTAVTDGRDTRRQSDYDNEQNYLDVRNEHGKRSRDISD